MGRIIRKQRVVRCGKSEFGDTAEGLYLLIEDLGDGRYIVRFPEDPHSINQGATVLECASRQQADEEFSRFLTLLEHSGYHSSPHFEEIREALIKTISG